jgi:hypothetical protein
MRMWSAVVAWLSGSGSDFAEEAAVRDARPVLLAFESFPLVLPGPCLSGGAVGVGDEVPVDGVADLAFERPERFLLGLAFGDLRSK